MSERCSANESFLYGGTIDELRESFPALIEVFTAGRFNDARHKHDVYALDKGTFIMVHIRGQCPNLKEDKCILAEKCLSIVKEDLNIKI